MQHAIAHEGIRTLIEFSYERIVLHNCINIVTTLDHRDYIAKVTITSHIKQNLKNAKTKDP